MQDMRTNRKLYAPTSAHTMLVVNIEERENCLSTHISSGHLGLIRCLAQNVKMILSRVTRPTEYTAGHLQILSESREVPRD